MIVPDTNLRPAAGPLRKLVRSLLVTALVGALVWGIWLYAQIRYFANRDDARSADAIAVFGAAEYDGRPSPVLRARLDHALSLYQKGIAPLMITLGGPGDDVHSEGGVGHDYLLAHRVPESQIIAETQSMNTEESARRLALIARRNHLQRIVIVSDGTHLFRIHALCSAEGLDVYGSPRPAGRSITRWEELQRLFHEMISYTAWRIRPH